MIDLKMQYEQAGLAMTAAELPDFLPLFLEYLATQSVAESCASLSQPAHIFAALAERLRKRGSSYEAVFRALVALSTAKPQTGRGLRVAAIAGPGRVRSRRARCRLGGQPVTFGPGAGDGCKDGLIARVRGAMRPAPDMPRPHPRN